MAEVLPPHRQRLSVHGPVSVARRCGRGDGPDVPARLLRVEGRRDTGPRHRGDDGPGHRALALLGIRRVRRGVVRAVRDGRAARVPRIRPDDRPEARRAVRRHVPQGVPADARGGGVRHNARRRDVGVGGGGMKDSVAVRRTAHARSHGGASPRAWSPGRVAGGLVLAAWAALFWFLLLTGRDALYLSTRTSWVVPVGAVLLTAAAAGLIVSARVRSPGRIATREAWVMGLMVVPVVMVLALPPATLGSFSASKRPGFSSAGFGGSLSEAGSGPLTLVDVAAAQYSKPGEQALARRAGEPVDFIGIVTRYADTP